jgi:hypothetical protein
MEATSMSNLQKNLRSMDYEDYGKEHFPCFKLISIAHSARLPKYLYVGQAKSIAFICKTLKNKTDQ